MISKLRKNIAALFTFNWFKKLGRNTKLAITLSSVLVLVGAAALIAVSSDNSEELSMNNTPQQIEEIETADIMDVKVTLVEGTLEYKTADADWELAQKEQNIEPNMQLRTVGAISRAVFTLDDGSEIRLDANSEIEIVSLTTNRVILAHTNGYVYNRTVPSESRDYIVETENAQFQSIGTAFMTIATGDVEGVEVYQSKVKEVNTNTEVESGARLIVTNTGGEVTTKTESIDIEELKDNEFIQWNKQRDTDSELFKDTLGFLSDFDAPELSITSPKPSTTVTVSSSSQEPTVEIEGTTEEGASLTVESKSVSGSKPQKVEVKQDGSFKTPRLKGSIGNSVFEFIVKDRQGNEAKSTVSYTFTRETTTVSQGIAATIAETDTEFTIEWGLVGLTAPDGVQVRYGEDEALQDENVQVRAVESGSQTAIAKSELLPGVTYYVEVCRFISSTGACDFPSNKLTMLVEPSAPPEE